MLSFLSLFKDIEVVDYKINYGFFTGTIRDGLPLKGKIETSINSTYEGEFNNGKFEGYGVYKSFFTYEGYWKNGKYHGYGKFIYNKKLYEGEFKEGIFVGNQVNTNLTVNCQKFLNDWENF